MKALKDYKSVLYNEETKENTMLGGHLNTLTGYNDSTKNFDKDATIHCMDEKIEVIDQMYKNGIDVFTDTYKIGSVTKAFYQVMLTKYEQYK